MDELMKFYRFHLLHTQSLAACQTIITCDSIMSIQRIFKFNLNKTNNSILSIECIKIYGKKFSDQNM